MRERLHVLKFARIRPALEVAGFFASLRMTILFPLQRFNASTNHESFVNLHDKLAVWIDIPAIHSRGIKWQSDVALTIDCNQSTSAAEFGDFIEHRLCRFLEGHSPIFHQCRDIVPDRCPNEILSVARRGEGAGRIIRISSCANNRGIAYAPWSLVCGAAG